MDENKKLMIDVEIDVVCFFVSLSLGLSQSLSLSLSLFVLCSVVLYQRYPTTTLGTDIHVY